MHHSELTECDFRLSAGGLVYPILVRLGLERPDRIRVGQQIVLSIAVLWLPLLVLSAFEGTLWGSKVDFTFLKDVGPHARFLVAVPLLVAASTVVDPIVRSVLSNLRASGVVPEREASRLGAAIERLIALSHSRAADLMLLILAFSLSWYLKVGYGDGSFGPGNTSWLVWGTESGPHDTWAGKWYLHVAAPLFLFALGRWLWRWAAWSAFVVRLSRFDLDLAPGHPDRAGGLGLLATAQGSFVVVFLAFAAVVSSTLAFDITNRDHAVSDVVPMVVGYIFVATAVVVLPLLSFAKQMARARLAGLLTYGRLGFGLTAAFDRKWSGQESREGGTEMLESAEPSTVADFNATYNAVQSMRIIPITTRNIAALVMILALPFLPLYLYEFSLPDLLRKLAESLI